jgi:beta-glucosidase
VLLAGPAGSSLVNQCGGWTLQWQGAQSESEFNQYDGTSTLFTGVQDQLDSGQVIYEMGCSFTSCQNLDPAYQTALTSDLIILAVGEAPESETVGDINDLTLSHSQVTLIRNITTSVKSRRVPIVLVLIEARPRILPDDIVQSVNAILHAYLPGPCKFNYSIYDSHSVQYHLAASLN